MKRFVLGKLFIISAALIVLSFISCNQNLKEENGMGKVVISLGNTARNVNTEGLPILDEHNTTITINVAGESEQHHHDHHPRTYHGSKISVEFPIGTQITVTATVSTPAGICWWGQKTLTVAAGVNNVSLELSKTPSYVPGVGVSLSKKKDKFFIKIGSNGSDEIERDLTVSKDFTPKIKRDGIGRVYVLYKDKDDSKKYLTRYTVEGDEDATFNDAVSKLSKKNQNFINKIENIAADTETGNIFLIEGKNSGVIPIYCVTEKKGVLTIYSVRHPDLNKINSAAAYNGTLFLEASTETGATHTEKLLAYTTKLKTVGERNELELKSAGETVIENISPEGQSGKTDCNDIHADGTGVYVLLSSTSLKGNIYSVGQINRYKHDGENFTEKAKVGCVGKGELKNGGIAFDGDKVYYNKFSKPVAFTGWGNDCLYIADDGINIVYKEASENFRVDGNKNRTATFNKESNKLSFNYFGITWYEEHSAYEQPNTPVLSWEKDFNTPPTFYGMRYWTSAYGKEAFGASGSKTLWESTIPTAIKPTDIFCYDQDGNLYIFYIENNDKMVRRFELKYDGEKFSYGENSEQYAKLNIPNEPTAIAVDISNGKNCLYYAYEISSENKCFIKKYESGTTSVVTKIEDAGTTITALAANKDGLFAAIKNVDNANTYTLTVKKYNKENGGVFGSVNVVEKEPSATSPDSSGRYDEYNSAINALQINNGSLYGIMSKEKRTKQSIDLYDFNNGSTLYDLGKTKEPLSKLKKPIEKNYDDTVKVGYGFYRFIAVKENKLVIASDGAAWLGQDSPPTEKNCNKVFVYDLKKNSTKEEDSECKLSKELKPVGLSLQWE